MRTTGDVQLSGKFAVAFVEGVTEVSPAFEDRALEILEENGIPEPQPDEQYSAESFVEAVEEMTDVIGSATTRKIAVSVVEAVEWPPEADSVESAFEINNDIYHQVYINADEEDLGKYRFEKTGDGEARAAVTEAYLYPAPFVHGVFKGILDEFTPESTITKVSETEAKSDEKCAFELSW